MTDQAQVKNITAIVETPKGAGVKYDYDPELGCMKLNKIMPAGLVFPFDFGYITATTGGDGDPLDVLIISEIQSLPGCAIDCRVIGGIKASQRERDGSARRNDRIIAVPVVSEQFAKINELKDVPQTLISQIETFFENYNQQAGKNFKPLKRLNANQAVKIIQQAADQQRKDTLVQLFIPMYDQKGNHFPQRYYQNLNKELKERFGGLTVYNRTPATGLWEQDAKTTVRDELLVYEILTSSVENEYWQPLKAKLEKQFAQTELLVLITKTDKL